MKTKPDVRPMTREEVREYMEMANRKWGRGVTFLSDRDVAQILAALRFWQSNDMTSETSLSELKDAGHFEDHAPMTTDEIDALCERINLGPAKP